MPDYHGSELAALMVARNGEHLALETPLAAFAERSQNSPRNERLAKATLQDLVIHRLRRIRR